MYMNYLIFLSCSKYKNMTIIIRYFVKNVTWLCLSPNLRFKDKTDPVVLEIFRVAYVSLRNLSERYELHLSTYRTLHNVKFMTSNDRTQSLAVNHPAGCECCAVV